jgi:hypothetical protein
VTAEPVKHLVRDKLWERAYFATGDAVSKELKHRIFAYCGLSGSPLSNVFDAVNVAR